MPHSERLAELAPLAALDALDGAERDEFAGHLAAGCTDCEAEVRAWRRDLARLGRAVAAVAPRPAVRSRLGASAALDPVAAPPRMPRVAPWLAVAASLALIVTATDDVVRRRSADSAAREIARLSAANAEAGRELAAREMRVRFLEDPDVQAILLNGLGPQAGARGKVIYSPRARRAIFVTADLAPLPPDRQYELWFLAAGKPVPAGVFDRREGAATVFESSPVPEAIASVEKFAVTIEPRGGVPQPTGPMVLAGG